MSMQFLASVSERAAFVLVAVMSLAVMSMTW